MSWWNRARLCGAVGCLGLTGAVFVLSGAVAYPRGAEATSATAARSARAPITGTLSRPGYTVLALAANGKATSVRVKGRKFSLRPRASSVTLQLRAANGLYAGPIVIVSEREGKRAIMGVTAGARLGKINVNVQKGFAKVARKPPKKWVDEHRWARATKGIPIGNGHNFGRVRSKPSSGTVTGDLDLDGVPDALDIDVNGNLILNNLDHSKLGKTLSTSSLASGNLGHSLNTGGAARYDWLTPSDYIKSQLPLGISQNVNVNAGSSDAEIDAALPDNGYLIIGIEPGDSVELDCRGLIYCSSGGSGRVMQPNPASSDRSTWPRFPDDFDADGDGLGSLLPNPSGTPGYGLSLAHRATTSQIGTGDLLIQHVISNEVETDFPDTLQYIFATVPALVSYSDGQGHSATVSYPVQAPGCDGPCPGPPGPGSRENPFPVAADPATGDVVLTLTFWRPQRRSIPPEAGEWIDIGGVTYGAGIPNLGSCPQSAFSEADPNLTEESSDYTRLINGGLTDLAKDQPSDRANTLTYTLNLTQCLSSNGRTFNPGEKWDFEFVGHSCGGNKCIYGLSSGPDDASQGISFKRT